MPPVTHPSFSPLMCYETKHRGVGRFWVWLAGKEGENAVHSDVLGKSSSLIVFCHCLPFALNLSLCQRGREYKERARWGIRVFVWKRSICQDGGASFPLPERRLGVKKCSEAQITFSAFGETVRTLSGLGEITGTLNYFHSHFGWFQPLTVVRALTTQYR